jgi:hypothetical protein
LSVAGRPHGAVGVATGVRGARPDERVLVLVQRLRACEPVGTFDCLLHPAPTG